VNSTVSVYVWALGLLCYEMHNYAAEKAGLKICHTFCLAYMSMMTTLCAKAVGQMGNGMAGKGPCLCLSFRQ